MFIILKTDYFPLLFLWKSASRIFTVWKQTGIISIYKNKCITKYSRR